MDDMESRKAAIHAHVAQRERAAREGRLREMDIPTLHKVPKPEPAPAPAGERDGELAREAAHQRVIHELQSAIRAGAETLTLPVQLALDDYCRAVRTTELAGDLVQRERAPREAGRAEMGEVVATACFDPQRREIDTVELHTQDLRTVTVDLVRRRGKEEG